MATTGDTFTLSPKERLTITGSAADSGGELLAMEARYGPGGSPPPEHYHPTQEEALSSKRMFEELSNAGSTFKQALVISRYKREFGLSNAPQRVLLDAVAPIARLVAR